MIRDILSDFGGILHATQDFWAHSNQIEMIWGVPGWNGVLISGEFSFKEYLSDKDENIAWWHNPTNTTIHALLNKDAPDSVEGGIFVNGRTLHDHAVESATFASRAEYKHFANIAPNTLSCIQQSTQ